jgi:ABC-type bacteriocin/lantibiotic exporter with double-glycine peptidase domain
VVFAIFVSSRIFNPLLNLTRQWDRFIQTKMALSRLNDIFLAPSEQRSIKKGSISSGHIRGEVEFRNVWFKYGDHGDWVLRDVNFKIAAGEKLAIVGPSGSGKSTISYLLSRIHEPTEGQIFVDGRDYREYDLKFFRENIGLLHQEPQILAGSVIENIAMNTLEPEQAAVERAAERASILTVIQQKPDGFEHRILHGGHGFSKGEKQRLTLARLFYSEPQVLVLDEATSALDGISERQIMDTIAREMSDRTIVNIVHRYSSLHYSNLVVMLKQGSVAGTGTVKFLAANNRTFTELFHLPLPGSDTVEDAA